MPGKYDPPAFTLKLAHKDVSLATALGRELGVPMRMCNLALAEMTEAVNRGWADSPANNGPHLDKTIDLQISSILQKNIDSHTFSVTMPD